MNLKRAIGGFLLSFIFLLVFVYLISGVQWIFENFAQGQNKEAFLGSVSGAVQDIVPENSVQPAVKPEISAESAISVESNLSDADKILFEKASDTKLPIASLTKLMTAVIVLDNYNLSDNITVDEIADSQDSMKQDVKSGDTMPAENFLEIMLVESSNKSAYALSEGPGSTPGEEAFVGLMNQKAKEIGLENTFFADPTGLSPQNVSTADDLVKLAEYILKNYPRIADISRVKEFYVPGFGEVSNTDQLLGEIPEIVCSKTGFTTQAKGCLLLVMNNPKDNGYLINVILGADDRFSEMKQLIDWQNAFCN
ncbi:MAG: serine hydrolase [Candidatus Staskawiczbacteria bacterium]|jgi:D-alanyl-D-alanine carboxypeptidase (penicillin-binding protein 5/6)